MFDDVLNQEYNNLEASSPFSLKMSSKIFTNGEHSQKNILLKPYQLDS